MTRDEFLKEAEKIWDKLQTNKTESADFYTYEKDFDALWVEFGRTTLEKSIGDLPTDRRKKKCA